MIQSSRRLRGPAAGGKVAQRFHDERQFRDSRYRIVGVAPPRKSRNAREARTLTALPRLRSAVWPRKLTW